MNSYWITREKEKLRANIKDVDEVNKKVKKNLDKAAKEIEDEIYKLYGRYAAENKLSYAEASKMLTSKEYNVWRMDLKEYVDEINKSMGENSELLLELNTLSAKSQISRLEESFYQIQKILNKDYAFKRKEVENLLKHGVKENFTQTAYSIDMYLGVHCVFNMISEGEIEDIIKLPWSGKNYSKRLWNNRTKLKDVLEDQITQATVQGKDLKQCARELAVTMEVSKKVAERLINTEHAYACSQGDLKMYQEFEIEVYEYLATLDIKTSEICRDLDGKKFSLSEAVPGVNYPPMHPHCRSTTVPADVDSLKNSTRIARDENGKNIYVDANLSYREWYKKYVEANPQYLLKEKKWKNRNSDKTQFEKYKSLGYNGVKSFEKFQDIKYNNFKEWDMVKGYAGIVQRGEISPLVGYNNFIKYHKKLENKLIGLKTSDGLEIKNVSYHFTGRAIGTHDWANKNNSKGVMKNLNHMHVPTQYIERCITNGNVFKKNSDSTVLYINECQVSVNQHTGNLIQCNVLRE